VKQRASQKQGDGAFNGNVEQALNDEVQRTGCGHQHHQRHGPHLAGHDLEGGYRHHQQVLDGAVFPFADQGGTGENDGEHGDVVDDLHDRSEPRLVQFRIEARPQGQIHRWG